MLSLRAPRPDELAGLLADAGFEAIVIDQRGGLQGVYQGLVAGSGCEDYVISANVTATKPGGSSCCQPGDKAAAASMAEAGVLAAKEAAERTREALGGEGAVGAQVGREEAPPPPKPPKMSPRIEAATKC